MSISSFELYVLMKLDAFSDYFMSMGILFLIVVSCLVIHALISCDCNFNSGDEKYLLRTKRLTRYKKMVIAPAAIIFFAVMLPTSRQVAALYILPKVINSDFIQKDLPADANEIYTLAREYLKGQLEVLKKQKDKMGPNG